MPHLHRLLIAALLLGLLPALLAGAPAVASIPRSPLACTADLRFNSDYRYAIGSAVSDADATPAWQIDGAPRTVSGAESLHLALDGSVQGTNGEAPSTAEATAFTTGRWGQALALGDGGRLEFPRAGNLSLNEGSIELWVALRQDGSAPVYSEKTHVLFFYRSANEKDYLLVAQSKSGILYGGGQVNGEWQSAYGSRASTRGWKAGEWHALTFTYSASGNFMRFYVDGALTADTNEDHYWAPPADGESFSVGGAPAWNNSAAYSVDEFRLSTAALDGDEAAARAGRLDAPRSNESWLSLKDVAPSSELRFSAQSAGSPVCQSQPLTYNGIPVFDPQPPTTLLPSGAETLELSVSTLDATTCAYSLGQPAPYAEMRPFGEPAPGSLHTTTLTGLDPDPNSINHVWVRCAAAPDFALHLRYRSLSDAQPRYPRTGNLWGFWQWKSSGASLEEMAKIDLWLGADSATPDEIVTLRRLNPHLRLLTSMNTVENKDVPEDYFLKDVNGDPIEVWPGSFRLNLTRLDVAEYQAHYAYQTWLDSGLMADGVFFDNVFTSQSWQLKDMWGNQVQIDANEDGVADDPAWLDAAWKAGVFHEIDTFRQMMPHAIVSGHAQRISEPGIAERFNGISLGFYTADVREGERSFTSLWNLYSDWMAKARPPQVTMFEASPPDQIAYGYSYEPFGVVPTTTLQFASQMYPDMRFGLGLTLMHDGYFAYEYGDTWHGNPWWYDELDFDLGLPLGPAQRANLGFDPGPNLVRAGDFESGLDPDWKLWDNNDAGCVASAAPDSANPHQGQAARVDISQTSGTSWHINFYQSNLSLQKDTVYDLTFWARSDHPRPITLSAQKGSPDWNNYGLSQAVQLDTAWQPYTVTFQATATAADARLQFLVGAETGTVWIDDVRLVLHPPDVFRRDFTNGVVLLNGTGQPQTISLESGLLRLKGTQAPMFDLLLDDTDPGFSVPSGEWSVQSYDSGEWEASPPFYHAWNGELHQLSASQGEARWDLPVSATDVYTVTAWWPAAPSASTWNGAVRYELVAGGQVVASATLDQRQAGDQWHLLFSASLRPADEPYVRLACSGAPCVADALHLQSQRRYNDGSPASAVQLAALDAILLRRSPTETVYFPLVAR